MNIGFLTTENLRQIINEIENRVDANTEPWGTPLLIVKGFVHFQVKISL